MIVPENVKVIVRICGSPVGAVVAFTTVDPCAPANRRVPPVIVVMLVEVFGPVSMPDTVDINVPAPIHTVVSKVKVVGPVCVPWL